ncbi:MAG: hypothetical protein JXB03_11150 [Spirochaetales bacterium]|nr:hypothetical protein [Spirochaetales bacterium]
MKKSVLVLLLLVLAYMSVMALVGDYGPVNGDIKVLVAYEPTRFKNRLVENLVDLLVEKNYSVKVVNHKKGELDDYNAGDFDAVFITNSGALARVRPAVVSWLTANGSDPENVFVHTTQTTVWEPQIEVDGTTSASLTGRDSIEKLAQEFSALISNIAERE